MMASATESPNDPSPLPQGVSLPASLEDVRIPSLPPAAYYISNFLSEDEERQILDKVLQKELAWKLLLSAC